MNDNKTQSPFFAQYVETQDFPKVNTDVKGGQKLPPSDWDQTQKAPSDADEFEIS